MDLAKDKVAFIILRARELEAKVAPKINLTEKERRHAKQRINALN
ncbi:MAG: hypothetical protein NW215_01750 [Hyphomicrobiales bacterium]|nr:hypothetical protein [Hyphomicrobiales bacterium]